MEIIATSGPSSCSFLSLRSSLLAASLSALLTACVTHRPAFIAGRSLELRSTPAVATMHFPQGVYTLDSTDATGFYYRAPRAIIKHSFAGPQPYSGGIFVSASYPHKLRGYVVWAGGLTKIGDLSREPHRFAH